MAYWASDFFTGTTVAAAITVKPTFHRPVPSPQAAGAICHVRTRLNFATGVNPATNDVIEMAVLPAGCTPIDWALYNDDLGSAELVAKMGLMTGAVGDITRALATVGEEIMLATSTALQQGNLNRRSKTLASSVTDVSEEAFAKIVPTSADRSIGIGWATQATTPTSGSTREIIFDLWYRAGAYSL